MFTLPAGRMPAALVVLAFIVGWITFLVLLLDVFQPDFTAGQLDHGPDLAHLLGLVVNMAYFAVLYAFVALQQQVAEYVANERDASSRICATPSQPNHIFNTAEAQLLDRIQGKRARQLMYVSRDTQYLADPEPDYAAQAQNRSELDMHLEGQQ